jgi:two-component system, OmpR family, response regulator
VASVRLDVEVTGLEVALTTRGVRVSDEGVATLARVRPASCAGPLILLVADAAALTAALDDGADDAVLATAGADEIAARIAARLRPAAAPLRLGELLIDHVARRVTRAGRVIGLLPREYALLLHLLRHAGTTVPRSALLEAVWGLRFDPGTNVVAVHVSRLRAKLDRGYARPMLVTDKGVGYRLVAA